MLRPCTVGAIRGLPRRQLALPPLPLRCGVHGGEVAAVVPEDVEPTLSLGQTVVVDPIGRELAVNPAHHPLRSHAWYVAGSGPVRQAVQGVERRVLRGGGGSRHGGWWGAACCAPTKGRQAPTTTRLRHTTRFFMR